MGQQKITPCLWFDKEAEEAAKFYIAIFKNSRIIGISYYGKEGFEIHGQKEGTAMTVLFELDGQRYTALNGGPAFKFTEAVSLQITCETQAEIDHYWNKLSAGGEEGPCGWLKDKYGLSWQVTPRILGEIMMGKETAGKERVMKSFMQMKKFDLAKIEHAFNGGK
jgi:predicted 3-demethylubiquinone-9 3-methyltransferase (glyoxalase superfamily)